ncbi:hypothetical protein E2C01_062043 [Portunus trituberculatus]|uniref:Uncharacterized protein n=1 Tax=Portunus trituberculatus TaxID=210409 RepID=A0A5B7HEV2_PORTR|nr:hypothetical protein [Portunus trituberculatus]
MTQEQDHITLHHIDLHRLAFIISASITTTTDSSSSNNKNYNNNNNNNNNLDDLELPGNHREHV